MRWSISLCSRLSTSVALIIPLKWLQDRGRHWVIRSYVLSCTRVEIIQLINIQLKLNWKSTKIWFDNENTVSTVISSNNLPCWYGQGAPFIAPWYGAAPLPHYCTSHSRDKYDWLIDWLSYVASNCTSGSKFTCDVTKARYFVTGYSING